MNEVPSERFIIEGIEATGPGGAQTTDTRAATTTGCIAVTRIGRGDHPVPAHRDHR
ncbi:hypothetical protein [Nocardia nova]|uniref:hypothetical protein n=1 Tax=Nocardia nova TaxID=37330 RepID=UPI0025B16299|nr:hypothetical protein [Nocardia nova]